jgi:Ni,Fe-hydrogenase I large subunit
MEESQCPPTVTSSSSADETSSSATTSQLQQRQQQQWYDQDQQQRHEVNGAALASADAYYKGQNNFISHLQHTSYQDGACELFQI